MNWDICQFSVFAVSAGYMHGCTSYVFVHKSVACIKFSIQNEVDMGIHQTKCQDKYVVVVNDDIYPVHSCNEIFVVVKDSVNGISVGSEVPAFFDSYLLPFLKRGIQSQVRFGLYEQVSVFHQLQSRASSGCSRTKLVL